MLRTELDKLEALRHAPLVNPADLDRGEVLLAIGAGLGVIGVGVFAASAICPTCVLGIAPLAAVTGAAVFAAGLVKRWRRRGREKE